MLELTLWLIAAAIAALILGAILSRVIEPGVRVEKVMLTGNTPALRLSPETPGPHPIALLAHGNGFPPKSVELANLAGLLALFAMTQLPQIG